MEGALHPERAPPGWSPSLLLHERTSREGGSQTTALDADLKVLEYSKV
jgi:hypothetical protein